MTSDLNSTPPDASRAGTDRGLELVWRRHRQWSVSAGAARARLDRWRLWNLGLLVLGAVAGAFAAQTWLASGAVRGFAILAAVALAVAGWLQANALNDKHTLRWTQARAASEALKAEVYRYRIRVVPYSGADRAQVLQAQLGVVQGRVPQELLVDQQLAPSDDRPLPEVRTFDDYVTKRAQEQMAWHRNKIAEHEGQAKVFRSWQLAATLAGVVLSAISGFVPEWRLTTWTAAATTIAAAFGAHLAASQHQRIAASYASTADQLEGLIAGIDSSTVTADEQAQFVADVERVLAAQNEGWTDLFNTKPSGAGQQQPKNA
jgi:diadenosine tetraphosphatase ApaH/serine/threonine PP2A family protein phosphatase